MNQLTHWLTNIRNLFGDTQTDIIINSLLMGAMAYFAFRWVIQPIYITLAGMRNFWQQRKAQTAFLEITPPKQLDKSPVATRQLFAVIERFLGKNRVMSLEIVSSRREGIRYLIRSYVSDMPALQRHLASYLSDAKFKVLEDSPLPELTETRGYARVYEITQSRHYGYPLQPHEDLSQSDPIAYVIGAMAKPDANETIAMQMVISPHHSYWTNRLYNKIHSKGYALLDGKLRYFLISNWWVWAICLFVGNAYNDLKLGASLAVILLIGAWVVRRLRPSEVSLTASEQKLYEDVQNKLGQPLFRADIRLLVVAESGGQLGDLSQGLYSSLAPLSVSGYQELIVRRLLGQKIVRFKLRHRLPSFLIWDSNVLAASELASIYHFPYGIITTEGMARSHSRNLPAPLAMKTNDFDVVLGQNEHHGAVGPIGLTAAERERHLFIIGGTGNGKTTMLEYAIAQDIQNGKGLAVVDPHGDMAEKLLGYIPEDRINDVIYFNPDDLTHPIGLNLLELPEGLGEDELLREKDLVTESVVSIFRKIFSEDDSGGHRIEYVLRNAVQTALTIEGATLFTVYDLLNDPSYRKKIIPKLDNKDLQNFWKHELGKAGGFQQVKMVAGITAKIGRFLFSASAKRILEQPKSTIDFDDILNGKILICNFSKGLLGEDTSELFGIAILAKLQIASLRRARQKQTERKPFYLYVDEFQNFATPSFVQMLSEARKYKLYLTMAEQSTSQQDDKQMVQIILANVGTVICFRSGNPEDEKLVLPLFQPYIKPGEIANLPSFNFYMRVAVGKPQEPVSGETVVLEESEGDEITTSVIKSSRSLYGQVAVSATQE